MPAQIHFKPAPRAQSFDRARRPSGRQRGQQVQFPFVALQKHFTHAGHRPEVSVNLERRVQVE